MIDNEEWRPVPGYAGYAVSDTGRVSSSRQGRPRLLSPFTDEDAYRIVKLVREDGRRVKCRVHQLVAAAFLGPRAEGLVVRHLDGDPTNNVPTNLAWGTASENVRDAVRHGTHSQVRKTHCPQGHPYDEANTYRDRKGRRCRTCKREFKQRYRVAARLAAVSS